MRYKMTKVAAVVFSYYQLGRTGSERSRIIGGNGNVSGRHMPAEEGEPKEETINGVSVGRLPLGRKRAGQLRYIFEYFAFTLLAFIINLSIRHLSRHYDVVHMHNMRDFGFSPNIYPDSRRANCLDLHDPTPEFTWPSIPWGRTSCCASFEVFWRK